MIYVSVDGWEFVITIQNLDNKILECFKEFKIKKKKKPQKFQNKNEQFLREVVVFFFFFLIKIIEVFKFK